MFNVFRDLIRYNVEFAIGTVLVGFIVIFSLLSFVSPYSPTDIYNVAPDRPPSAEHWFGTNSRGQDLFWQLTFAFRNTLVFGVIVAVLSRFISIGVGLAAGYLGGWVDRVVSRFADAVSTFPALFLILTISSFVPPSIFNVIAIIGLLSWMPAFRLMRAEVLKLRATDFVEAAGALGAGDLRVMSRHLVPNAVGPIVVQATLGVAEAILTESALSFLGLGVQPPIASWGNMLADARSITVLQSQPWLWLPPGLAIFITVLSINFFGDGLRATIDPQGGKAG